MEIWVVEPAVGDRTLRQDARPLWIWADRPSGGTASTGFQNARSLPYPASGRFHTGSGNCSTVFADLSTLLRESDFLSLHAPLNPESNRAIGAAELGLMKPNAILINTSRGKIVDEEALVSAGSQVHPALLEMKNVVMAPHIASATVETRLRMAELAAENLLAALDGRRPPNILNPEVLG
jgi:lactate dehydrogenase-like 2-hydroxyacid dehydrogenase